MLAQEVNYYSVHDINRNYGAAVLAVLGRMSVEKALRKVADIDMHHLGTKPDREGNWKYTDDEVREMARLRKEGDGGKPMTYADIAALYGTSTNVIYVTLKRRGLFEKGHIGKVRGQA
jgi:hypothetical protein